MVATRAPLLDATLGEGRVVARQGDRRLFLLDASAAALWDLHSSGLEPAQVAAVVAERFGLAIGTALSQVTGVVRSWREGGLLEDSDGEPEFGLRSADEPVLPEPRKVLPTAGTWRLRVADRTASLECADGRLRHVLSRWATHWFNDATTVETVDYRVRLLGSASDWQLTLNEKRFDGGAAFDAALVATVRALTELGCRPAERLVVLHGAGLVAPDGRGVLLVAPGGSGKTTLAATLDAHGFGLLSDDVVPVTPNGHALGLDLPLCLKAGSWPVLRALRPDLDYAPVVQRFGRPVRLVPPQTQPAREPVKPVLLVMPCYRPGVASQVQRLVPEQVLQGIIESDSVLRELTQAKLEALARWASAVPAYRIGYPNLECGLHMVMSLLEQTEAASGLAIACP